MAGKKGGSPRSKSESRPQNPISVLQQLRRHRFFEQVALRLWNEYTSEARFGALPSAELQERLLRGGRDRRGLDAAVVGQLLQAEIDWPIITAVDVYSDSEDEPGEAWMSGFEIFALLRSSSPSRPKPGTVPQPAKTRSKRADYERERSAKRRLDAVSEQSTVVDLMRRTLDLPNPADEATVYYRPSADDDPERRDWEPTEGAREVVHAADSVWLKSINSMNGVAQHLNKLGFTTLGSSSPFKANNVTPVLMAVELIRGNEYRVGAALSDRHRSERHELIRPPAGGGLWSCGVSPGWAA